MDNKTQEELAKLFSKRFEEYNTLVLKDIAEMIKKFKGLNYTEAHKLAQQLKYDKSYIDMVDELSKLSGKSKKEIKDMLEEVAKQNIEFADTFYKARNMNTPIYGESKTLQNIVNGVVNVAGDDFTNIARSTGFAFLDKDNHIQFLNMRDTYYKVIDDCVYAVQTGQDTFDNVMRNTINQLAESGVRRIVYANDGKEQYTQRLDTAVRRNILDSIRQVSNETQIEFGKEFNADGVEVTVHSNPAPDHASVQGHQFTLKEFKKFQNDQDCVDVKGNRYSSEHNGKDRRSIGQYNCYHTVFSIIVGVSDPLYSDEELQEIIDKNNQFIEIDGKQYTKYEVTQLQRKLETEIRKSKDKHIMYKETDDKIGMLKEQKRITQLTRKYKEITNKANIPSQLDRARVSGYKRASVKNLQEPKINNLEEIEYARKNNKIYHSTAYLEDIVNTNKLNAGSIAVGKEINERVKYGTQFIVFKPEILQEINKQDILFKGDGGKIEQNTKRFDNLMDMLKDSPINYNELKTKKDIDIIQYIDYVKLRDDEPKGLYKLLEDNNIKYTTYHSERVDIFREDRKKRKK